MGGNQQKDLYKQLMEVMSRVDSLESEQKQNHQKVKSLRKENASLHEEVSSLRHKNAVLTEECNKLRDENSLLRNDNERIKRILNNNSSKSPPIGPTTSSAGGMGEPNFLVPIIRLSG